MAHVRGLQLEAALPQPRQLAQEAADALDLRRAPLEEDLVPAGGEAHAARLLDRAQGAAARAREPGEVGLALEDLLALHAQRARLGTTSTAVRPQRQIC